MYIVCKKEVVDLSQINLFLYKFENKCYYIWNYYLCNYFGYKVFKVVLDGGFDCLNRDGMVVYGGCMFCSVVGLGDFVGNRVDDLVI